MLSNSDTPFTRELYRDYDCRTVYAPRAINTDPAGRGRIPELLVLNYALVENSAEQQNADAASR